MIDFIEYYKLLEQKLKEKDYSQDMEVVKKERKKPKRRQNQIFILPKK
tara:strand:+ start:1776 stop:1919 length:144 start_codon:yes stop_codon:yes gene_type:complete